MPLVSDPESKPLSHSNSRAIGFWMSVEGRTPIQSVRVLVSYEALSELDPTNVRDLHGALENFNRFRLQIESAASRKFDRDGFDPDKYEGMPAIRLVTQRFDVAGAARASFRRPNTTPPNGKQRWKP
jgi:hypothetical protein